MTNCPECVRGLTEQREVCSNCGGTALIAPAEVKVEVKKKK